MRRALTLLFALAAAAGVAVFRNRPVKPPAPEGEWRPVPR